MNDRMTTKVLKTRPRVGAASPITATLTGSNSKNKTVKITHSMVSTENSVNLNCHEADAITNTYYNNYLAYYLL